jgi:hypothetical protein
MAALSAGQLLVDMLDVQCTGVSGHQSKSMAEVQKLTINDVADKRILLL